MSQLLELQDQFQNYLLHSKDDINKHVAGYLSVYHDAYRYRLYDALSASYPVLHTYLGDEQFEELCSAYVQEFPSNFRSIRWYGDQLPQFIKTFYSERYLSELAQFEWTCCTVFDAANADVLQLEEMARIPHDAWADMKFIMHPTMQRLNLSWNVVQIWKDISEEKEPSEPQESPTPVNWIVWRQDLTTQFSSLSIDEAWAIDAAYQGANFAEICEGLCNWVDENQVAMHAASLLKNWIISGWIVQIIML